ncbi:TAXI family TRAP transporter solute-binding subunit, partial [Candidatus Roizmanbacteria bacterium]|nr:TAXI family TRAP transporter solute-binding subunit [Candidatus Roizmanbacteria bacterium]
MAHTLQKYKLYLLVFSFCVLRGTASYAEDSNILTLATGSEKGVYYAIGQGISDVAKRSNIKINVISSRGSVENLSWLSQGKIQLCMAQSDTVYNAYNGLGLFKEKISNIRAIASLYTEAVHILIRNPLLIKKIGDFKGKRISIGPEGSGTESNATAILEAAGIT